VLGLVKLTSYNNIKDNRIGCQALADPAGLRAGPAGASYYLEYIANVSSWLETTCDTKAWFVTGECDNGHRFAKEIVCGKEWCPVCGAKGSVAHNRRFARWLKKMFQVESLGYLVFTIPEGLRMNYRTKKAMAGIGTDVQELLKKCGFIRGLRRWHFFGDKSKKYNPHLNCLVDGGYITEAKLDAIKAGYARLLGVEMADVNYRYFTSPGKMVHTLRYVTRATFLDYEWDIEMAMELRGFRNMVVWGRGQWECEPVWSLTDLKGKAKAEVEGLDIKAIGALADKICPVCGEGVVWSGALPVGLLNLVDKKSLGAGYYRLADARASPGLPDDIKRRIYWLEVVHRVKVQDDIKARHAEALAEAECQAVLWKSILN
jgi:rRNA maturation protein Nop10